MLIADRQMCVTSEAGWLHLHRPPLRRARNSNDSEYTPKCDVKAGAVNIWKFVSDACVTDLYEARIMPLCLPLGLLNRAFPG